MDIEDQILKTNLMREPDSDEDVFHGSEGESVDGDYDDDDDHEDDGREHGEEKMVDPVAAVKAMQEERARALAMDNSVPAPLKPLLNPSSHTGPKGVLADYKRHQEGKAIQAEREALQRAEAIRRGAFGVESATPSLSLTATAQVRKQVAEGTAPESTKRAEADADDDDNDDIDGEDDDETSQAIAAYRVQRMKQMLRSTALPHNGELISVGPFELLTELEHAHPDAWVVVHLYESFILPCTHVNKMLAKLAAKHPTIKFLRFCPTTAQDNFDHVILPALQLYKTNKLVDTIIRITDEVGEKPTEEDLEWLLETHHVL